MGSHYVMQPKCSASSARMYTYINCDSHIINPTSMQNNVFNKNEREKEFTYV